ncbi:MAG: pyridoxamine 5'-phosphate oxidase family protein [Gammaproteobacteria bacterium]
MPNSTPHSKRVKSLTESEITELLRDQTGPVRLASLSANGFPLISTIWFLYENGLLWCITQQRTLLRRNLAADPRCGFEIGLDGQRFKLLRGQGLATLDLEDGERVTELMINRYMRDRSGPAATAIRAQIPTEYAIAIKPRWVRGQGAGLRRKKA